MYAMAVYCSFPRSNLDPSLYNTRTHYTTVYIISTWDMQIYIQH
jgi:hypothetical protein